MLRENGHVCLKVVIYNKKYGQKGLGFGSVGSL